MIGCQTCFDFLSSATAFLTQIIQDLYSGYINCGHKNLPGADFDNRLIIVSIYYDIKYRIQTKLLRALKILRIIDSLWLYLFAIL